MRPAASFVIFIYIHFIYYKNYEIIYKVTYTTYCKFRTAAREPAYKTLVALGWTALV